MQIFGLTINIESLVVSAICGLIAIVLGLTVKIVRLERKLKLAENDLSKERISMSETQKQKDNAIAEIDRIRSQRRANLQRYAETDDNPFG